MDARFRALQREIDRLGIEGRPDDWMGLLERLDVESDTVEFKSCLFLDVQRAACPRSQGARSAFNQDTVFSVLKTIHGMANRGGGVIFVGISERGARNQAAAALRACGDCARAGDSCQESTESTPCEHEVHQLQEGVPLAEKRVLVGLEREMACLGPDAGWGEWSALAASSLLRRAFAGWSGTVHAPPRWGAVRRDTVRSLRAAPPRPEPVLRRLAVGDRTVAAILVEALPPSDRHLVRWDRIRFGPHGNMCEGGALQTRTGAWVRAPGDRGEVRFRDLEELIDDPDWAVHPSLHKHLRREHRRSKVMATLDRWREPATKPGGKPRLLRSLMRLYRTDRVQFNAVRGGMRREVNEAAVDPTSGVDNEVLAIDQEIEELTARVGALRAQERAGRSGDRSAELELERLRALSARSDEDVLAAADAALRGDTDG